MNSPFAARIRQEPAPIGTIVSTASIEVADVLAGCGFDWLFLDAEHGALTIDGVQGVLSVVQDRVPALVRIPDDQEIWIKKALDAGADGIIVPQVNTADAARRIVERAKYAPLGSRSVGIGRAHRYGNDFAGYLKRANESTSVIVQVEHRDAVDNIEEIVKVDGIDAVFIGPYDLSASLGCVGEVGNPLVQDAIKKTRAVCADANLAVGIFALGAAAAKSLVDDGYDFIAVGIDMATLDSAARLLIEQSR